MILALVGGGPAGAALNDTPDPTWQTDGSVYAAVRTADRIYLGGSFTHVAPHTGGFARLVSDTGALEDPAPPVSLGAGDGKVYKVLDDGAGGFYLGGAFDAVGGLPRGNLAHIQADGTVDPGFAPVVDGVVRTMARIGSTLYVAGAFTQLGGVARSGLAAVDASGAPTEWAPTATAGADAGVYAMAVSGSTVYLGGTFSTLNGAPRSRAGAVDAATGATTAWDPNPTYGNVAALAAAGPRVYLGGSFTGVGGAAHRFVAAVDSTSGAPDVGFAPAFTAGTYAATVAVSGSTLYVGGEFSGVNGQTRHNAAAFDLTTNSDSRTGVVPR